MVRAEDVCQPLCCTLLAEGQVMGSEAAHDDAPDLEGLSGLDVRTRLAEALDAIRHLNEENRRLRARVASLTPQVVESAPHAPEAGHVNSTSAANAKN